MGDMGDQSSRVAAPSPNPPGDTTLVAEVAHSLLSKIPGVEISRHEPAAGVVNIVARISSGRPGKRLVFNGHLDTYPLCEHLPWTVPPTGGVLQNGRVYGRGVSDMKGGIAASITAATVLAQHRELWAGEIMLTLAGDEESIGSQGSQWLLDNVEFARGDAMVCGDVGSRAVVRFGEKGLCWFEISAAGTSAHGAHVHRGINAIDRMRAALDAVKLLELIPVHAPEEVEKAIATASEISERASGAGESETLQRVTVNIGCINGGTLRNLIPSSATAEGDIRLPVGVSLAKIMDHLHEHLDKMDGVSWKIIQAYEATYTSPSHPLVRCSLAASERVTGQSAVANMRAGASDSRLYRAAGISSVVVGLTPYGMGAEDEYVEVEGLLKLAQIHILITLDFLKEGN
ncbi:Succinyl-diaminopimelate desuccinylase [Lachnellula occidentalis]|uniref:Succinyl-diaminopimelate desuccinylase n=1 Tax=Lachnellula occidentalis TaxID=215460 RepID=A0A8H8RLQ0_9HELO|nr:Succinyl-diaminopimelate desuccinylase [Lachnellula occidentalis]